MHNSTISSEKLSAREIFLTFLSLGLTSFGGPIAHIGYFRKEFVVKRKWLSEEAFTQLLTISQFLPGPGSSQLGFSIGLLKGGWLGAFAAFVAFTLPSVLILLLFAGTLSAFTSDSGQALIHGLKIVACVVVADALLGMYKNLCQDRLRKLIAIMAALIVLTIGSASSQIIAILIAALIGYMFIQKPKTSSNNSSNNSQLESNPNIQVHYSISTGKKLIASFFLLLFALPLLGNNSAGLIAIADVFYHAGALVFGGGHVVLPLLEESIVNSRQWLNEAEFLAGYGASQAIPGPMFSFSAYLGALIPNEIDQNALMFLVQALIATLFMFLPGFLLMAGILPFWQKVTSKPLVFCAIAGVNAAVVGILGAALYDPILTSGITSNVDLSIALVGFALLRLFNLSPIYVVLWCSFASLLWI